VLAEGFPRVVLVHDAVEQLAAGAKLQHDVHVLAVLEAVEVLDDVRVVHLLHYVNLGTELSDVGRPCNLSLRDRLHCDSCLVRFPSAAPGHAELALAELRPESVLI
jgi:hypothetical protein